MEESKLSDLLPQTQANWLWQSDPEPWKESDPSKWTWEAYSSENSDLIEKVFLQNQRTADLGGYEIDFKRMVQVNKKNPNRVRRVKRDVVREEQSRFLIELPRPLIVEKAQKTINHAFGTVQHFLDYIMKRTPEAYALFHRLKNLGLDSKQSEYCDIVEEVVKCIQKGAESREKVIKTRSSKSKSFIQEAKEITAVIRSKTKNDVPLRGFLKVILRIYTMESFICYWLNELLRSENWEDINILTPYLVCLTYAFQVEDYIIKYHEPKDLKESFLNFFKSRTLLLYRGTALVKEHLDYYKPTNTSYFSWNGVTSTSRSKEQAIRFIKLSMKRAHGGDKCGVIFIIEAEYSSIKDCEGMIDVSQDSRYPEEQEVILAPGTVFKLVSLQLNKTSNIYEVKLKLKKKFEQNQKLLGSLQNQVISTSKAVLKNLKHEEVIKALQLIEGNQLVTKLEIESCKIDSHLLDLIENVRATTNIKKENIAITLSTITMDSLTVWCNYFSPSDLTQICKDNEILFKSDPNNSTFKKEKILSLEKDTLSILYDKKLWKSLCNEIQNQIQITHLNLAIKNLQVPKNDLSTLIDSIYQLPSLQFLSLNFAGNQSLTDQELILLASILKSLPALEHLTLNFRDCINISDEGLHKLKEGLKALTSLKHLSIDLLKCQISEKGLRNLKYTFEPLKKLEHLSLGLLMCGVKNKDLGYIKEALVLVSSLKHLALNFRSCNDISDEGIESLREGLVMLKTLQNITLNFKDCKSVSDQALGHLKDALSSLPDLQEINIC